MGGVLAQPRGQVQVNPLIAEAGGGLQHSQLAPALGAQTRFLGQLPLGAQEGILIRAVQLAGGNLQRQPTHGDAVLAHQDHLALVINGHDGGGPGVAGHLPQGGFAVGELHLPVLQADDHAGVDHFAIEKGFGQLGIVHGCSLLM